MLRSTWPVVGFRSDSLWDRGQDALDFDKADGRRGRFETAPYPGA